MITSALIVFVFAFLASAVQRVSGFGFGITIMMVLPFIVPTLGEATALSGSLAVLTSVGTAYKYRKELKLENFIPIILTFLVFSFISVKLVTMLNGRNLRPLIGAVLVIVGCYFLFFSHRVKLPATRPVQIGMGMLSGIMGGFFAMQGPPAVIYFLAASRNKDEYIAYTQWYFLIGNLMMTIFRAHNGLFTAEVGRLWIVGFTGVLLGLWIGASIYRKINLEVLRLIVYIFLILSGLLSITMKNKSEDTHRLDPLYSELKEVFENDLSKRVIQPAEGYLKYPYLIPAGFYKQMWDWDGFFMGYYFCTKGKPEYLRYWALNLIEGIDEKGYVSGCATTKGPRPIFGDFCLKPFLSQGVWYSASKENDFEWVEDIYDKLCLSLEYREKSQQDESTGLFFWQIAMQSGADNNVALNYFKDDTRSFLAADCSALQYREYRAQALIAERLGKEADARKYNLKADALKEAMLKYLWCSEDNIFYNVDRQTGDFYKRISYSCFVPLAADILPQKEAKMMIKRYLVNEKHMMSAYGIRSLSLQDPDYNNKNIIKPFSNWQGPVWCVSNFIYAAGLHRYGFDSEVAHIGEILGNILLEDYKKNNTLHECYHADTGEALAPDDSYKGPDGKIVGFVSWDLCVETILQGPVTGEWNMLEL